MHNLLARLPVGLIALLVLLALACSGSGSDSESRIESDTRLPPTVQQASDVLLSNHGPRTVRDFQYWSRVTPRKVAATIYHWRLADDWLLTVTMSTEQGEVITCFGRKR
jgi:hypothetical protein